MPVGQHHLQFFDKDHTADVFRFVDQNGGEDEDNEAGGTDSDDKGEEGQGSRGEDDEDDQNRLDRVISTVVTARHLPF
jgi:hypothetical protein